MVQVTTSTEIIIGKNLIRLNEQFDSTAYMITQSAFKTQTNQTAFTDYMTQTSYSFIYM